MRTILLNIVAVVAGAIIGSIVNMAIVTAGHALIPPPAGMDVNDPASFRQFVHLLESKHFVFPLLAHAGGTLVGAVAASLLAASRRAAMSYVVSGLFQLGGIAACLMIPAPVWFVVLDLLGAYVPMAWLGVRLAGKLRPAAGTTPAGPRK